MNVLIAIDSFKGSLTSYEAGKAVYDAIIKVYKDAEITIEPLADGGEGTTEVFKKFYNADSVKIDVKDPLYSPVNAEYCILNNKTAIIEMAAASGITLIDVTERNPLKTSTYGVGELIKDAVNKGCRQFIIGIGGSATNDGGTGILSALGFEFLDKYDNPVPFGAEGLRYIKKIRTDNVLSELFECSFKIACDVTNPLCGKNGCSYIYGPQKGATDEMVENMDKWLSQFAKLTKEIRPHSDENLPGCGAAGGLGFAFASYLNSTLRPGIDIILEETDIEKDIINADIVITGEGRLDSQTINGKAPIGIAKLAKKYGKRVIAFSGCVSDDAEICNTYGIDAFFPILRNITTVEDAMNKDIAYKNLYNTAYQVFRLIKSGE